MEKEKIIENKRYGTAVIIKKNTKPQMRLLIGIPTTGLVRIEWMCSRYGQVIPCNWSSADFMASIDQISPVNFLVADAQNLIVKHFIEGEFEWLLFIEHDNCIPPDFFIRMNEYMIGGKVPVVSGLYFTKSVPAEPLVYRGRGNGHFRKWKLGDKVWVDGLGMGTTLIHRSILEAMYQESEEYAIAGGVVRKVFETPARVFIDPETGGISTSSGTSDLAWCSRIMDDDIFKKAGWPKYQKKQYPFLIDTNIFSWHIDPDGNKYPTRGEHLAFVKKNVPKK